MVPDNAVAVVPAWLIRSDRNGRAVQVYAWLAAHSREVRVPRQVLADELGISLDTLDRAVAFLVEQGALEVEQHRDESGATVANTYHVRVGARDE